MTFLSQSRHATRPLRRRVSLLDLLSLARQRRALSALDAEARADMGLSKEDVARESGRAFWDVPDHWRG